MSSELRDGHTSAWYTHGVVLVVSWGPVAISNSRAVIRRERQLLAGVVQEGLAGAHGATRMEPRAFTCAVILAAVLLRGAADVLLLDYLFMECGKIGGGGSRPEANAKRRDECAQHGNVWSSREQLANDE